MSDTLEVCDRRAFGRPSAFADARTRPRRRSIGADAPPSRDFNRRRAYASPIETCG